MKTTKLHSGRAPRGPEKQPDFKRKKVLADALKQKAAVKALLQSKSRSKSNSKPRSKSQKSLAKKVSNAKIASAVNMNALKINMAKDLQDEVANKLFESYTQSQNNVNSSAYLMWGIGFVLPTAFEAASVLSGVASPNLPIYVVTNLLFAAAFRFTVGNEIVGHHKHSSKAKAKQAVGLVKSKRITSEHAEATLVRMAPAEEAYLLLNDGLNSERAQLLLVDKFAFSFPVDKLRELSRNERLGSVVRARLESVLRRKEATGSKKN